MVRRRLALLVGISALLLAAGCKSGYTALKTEVGREASPEEIFDRITNEASSSDGFRGRIRARLEQANTKKEVTLSVRYAKDEGLLFSAPLGVAKALVTPDKFSYYNKLNRTYFEGAMNEIDTLLPIQLSFERLERLLNAEMVFNEEAVGAMKSTKRLKRNKNQATYASAFNSSELGNGIYEVVAQLNPLRIVSQKLTSDKFNTPVTILYFYPAQGELPSEIIISAADKKLQLFLSGFEYQKGLPLPFQIPSGYRRALK